jgi:DNA-directed RNA polymerase subunit RPC12/RpoP
MKKIVDLDKWKEFTSRLLDDLNMGAYSVGAKHMAYDATKWLEAQPDAEEKHGKWKRVYNRPKSIIFQCSLCGGEAYKYIQEYSYPYCPNCGAKMDLGEEA